MKREFISIRKILAFASFLIIVSACEKKEDTDKAFVGEWESRAYDAYSLQGTPIKEKMVFTFTNNTFEDKIYQGASAENLVLAAGIKGSVANPSEGNLDVIINEISLQGGAYTDKTTDPESFAQKFNASLGKMLHEQFNATYTFSNDSMILSLPVKHPQGGSDITQTLKLSKVK